ncbi:hypothetical protein ACFV0G_12155, partial [Kitasatospora sp. NPDC059571]
MTRDQFTPADPVKQYPGPDFPEQQQPHPGHGSAMDPAPDYGEETYRGTDRLKGRIALVTGADSGIGRAVALAIAPAGAHGALCPHTQ